MRVTRLNRSKLQHFKDLLPENMEYLLRCAFWVSSLFIEPAEVYQLKLSGVSLSTKKPDPSWAHRFEIVL